MATGSGYSVNLSEKFGSDPVTDESSESEGETRPSKAFHRRISTSKAIKSGVSNIFTVEKRNKNPIYH